MLQMPVYDLVEKVCPSKSKAFYLGEQQDQERKDTQKVVVYLGNERSDSDDATEQGECLAFIQRINIIRYTLPQPNKTYNWRKTAIFHTWMKIGDKYCKIIVDSGSCINVVFWLFSIGSGSPLSLQSLLG